jgi:hypothetical protein
MHMGTEIRLEKCLPFISAQLQSPEPPPGVRVNGAVRLAVTISRQSGSGAHVVAEQLAHYLQDRTPDHALPWMVFDRNLVEQVLDDHHLPQRLARFMPEDRTSEVADILDELLGLHPPSWTLVRQTAETILRLAEQGNVILIGRGANLITGGLKHVLHVRLVGSLEKRVEHMRQTRFLMNRAALKSVLSEDRGRRRYLKKYFGQDPDDPLLYHLVLNTDIVSYDEAARMIGDAALTGMHLGGLGTPKRENVEASKP